MKKTIDKLQKTHVLIDLSSKYKGLINGVANLYVPKNEKNFWCDNLLKYVVENVNRKPEFKLELDVYKQCSKSKEWCSINEFKIERRLEYKTNSFRYIIRSSSWLYDFQNQTQPEHKAKKLEWLSNVKNTNLQFIKYWMYGNNNEELKCLVTKKPIKKLITNPFNINEQIECGTFYLHHFLVRDGVSVLKEEPPSKYLNSPTLLENENAIKDLAGTILVCDDAHKMIHSLYQNSGLNMYDNSVIPFGLQSQENFDIVKEQFPILENIDYIELKNSLLYFN